MSDDLRDQDYEPIEPAADYEPQWRDRPGQSWLDVPSMVVVLLIACGLFALLLPAMQGPRGCGGATRSAVQERQDRLQQIEAVERDAQSATATIE
jgi:hypothetical protein